MHRVAGVGDPVPTGPLIVSGDEGGSRDDIHARRQNALQLANVNPHGVVDHAVWFQREQGVDVVRGQYSQGFHATNLTDIATDLLRRPRIATDQFEEWVRRQGLDGTLADISRRPLDDPVWCCCIEHSHSIAAGSHRNRR